MIGMSRTNLYHLFTKPDLPASYIFRIGEAIDVDFTEMIPGLKKELIDLKKPAEVNEPETVEEIQTPYQELDVHVHLDGTEGTLEKIIQKLIRVNDALKFA